MHSLVNCACFTYSQYKHFKKYYILKRGEKHIGRHSVMAKEQTEHLPSELEVRKEEKQKRSATVQSVTGKISD